MPDSKRISAYFEQFAGEEPNNGAIVIYTEHDFQRFEQDMRKEWAEDHWRIIEEWRDMQTNKEQKDA